MSESTGQCLDCPTRDQCYAAKRCLRVIHVGRGGSEAGGARARAGVRGFVVGGQVTEGRRLTPELVREGIDAIYRRV